MLQLVSLHQNTKKLHSVFKGLAKFSRQLDLEINNGNHSYLKPTELGGKTKKAAKKTLIETTEIKVTRKAPQRTIYSWKQKRRYRRLRSSGLK